MYKATVTKTFSEFKRLNFGLQLFGSTIGIVIITLLGDRVSQATWWYSLLIFGVFIASWMFTGILSLTPRKGELRFENDLLKLKWMKDDEVIVDLKAVSPKYSVKNYYPLGLLWKIEYIHLFLDGGPMGSHDFYFMHDGEYNASQWKNLPIEQLALGSSLKLAQ